ncbi:MAG TPA: VCBS repeat-containing protein [Planctomycetota bacterium]|nr:VCBS repeat-containing protein [Planctomycetota bacterium]
MSPATNLIGRILLIAVLLLCTCALALSAQVPMHVFQGGPTLENYGREVCAAGDVNGDGHADIAISAPDDDGSGPGRIEIRSGRDGSLLHELLGTAPGDEYGAHLAPLGDLDGDGQPELIVASANGKVVDVLSGRTFAAIHHYQLPPGPVTMGWGLADVGDMDGDGRHDFSIAGSEGDAIGFVSIMSGGSGALLLLKHGSKPGDLFGTNVAGAGDVNGDGHPDFLVKRNQADIYFQGFVSCFSGQDGSLLGTLGGGNIGTSMGAVGDLDGDGGDEVILGAPQFQSPHFTGPGYALVYSWKTNTTLFEFTGELSSDDFGYRVGGLGDVDADGVADFFITSLYAIPDAGSGLGKAFVRSGADGSLLFSVEGQAGNGNLGGCAAAAGDVDGDGRCDLIVGARDGSALLPSGHDGYVAVHVIAPPFTWAGLGLAGTLPAPILYGLGTLQPASVTEIGLNGALPGAAGTLIAGFAAIDAPFKGGTLVPLPQVLVPLPPVGPDGHLQLVGHWPPGLPAGTPLYLQAWLADALGPAGFAASNALEAVTP